MWSITCEAYRDKSRAKKGLTRVKAMLSFRLLKSTRQPNLCRIMHSMLQLTPQIQGHKTSISERLPITIRTTKVTLRATSHLSHPSTKHPAGSFNNHKNPSSEFSESRKASLPKKEQCRPWVWDVIGAVCWGLGVVWLRLRLVRETVFKSSWMLSWTPQTKQRTRGHPSPLAASE